MRKGRRERWMEVKGSEDGEDIARRYGSMEGIGVWRLKISIVDEEI